MLRYDDGSGVYSPYVSTRLVYPSGRFAAHSAVCVFNNIVDEYLRTAPTLGVGTFDEGPWGQFLWSQAMRAPAVTQWSLMNSIG